VTTLTLMSLNGQDMIDLIPKDLSDPPPESAAHLRANLLGQLIRRVDPDVLGLVEAPPSADRTQKFVTDHLDNAYDVHHAELRGALGLAFLVRASLHIQAECRSKSDSNADFPLKEHDSDGDGIKEVYSWRNRVPFEVLLSGGPLSNPVTFILIHSKSKGAFIPGDLFAYQRLSRANRMKLKAQAHAVRTRLDKLIDKDGRGRVIVMGDMNDSPEFDFDAAVLGGGFLEPIMGSVWDPKRILHNPHRAVPERDRWTIDFKDRVVNPLEASRYGQPTDLRSWIDHILLSPELADSVVPGSARVLHDRPRLSGRVARALRDLAPTDHHPPYVEVDL
jgi:hypothetical protein